jgi:sporulation protein YlmC with PRC-barrel domain
MRLSRFLGLPVVDAGGHPVGTVVDVRLTISGDLQDNPSTPRVLGLVVSPRTKSSFLGYERKSASAPTMLAALLRYRHRGTFLAGWEDVARVGTDRVVLRPEYTRYSAVLPADS